MLTYFFWSYSLFSIQTYPSVFVADLIYVKLYPVKILDFFPLVCSISLLLLSLSPWASCTLNSIYKANLAQCDLLFCCFSSNYSSAYYGLRWESQVFFYHPFFCHHKCYRRQQCLLYAIFAWAKVALFTIFQDLDFHLIQE